MDHATPYFFYAEFKGEREWEEAWVASCSNFGVSNPGSNPIGRAFARVESSPAGGRMPGA
jgi:hypothetical protein